MTAEKPDASQRRGGGFVGRWFRRLRLAVLLVVVALVLIVMFQNIEKTPYQVLFWQVPVSRLLALLIVFLAGAAAGALALAAVRGRR
jgi:uncharacterized integral membrane protein